MGHVVLRVFLEDQMAALVQSLTDRNEELEGEVKRKNEQLECQICMDKPKNMIFTCGHFFCMGCAERMETCPTCKRPVTGRFRVYFD